MDTICSLFAVPHCRQEEIFCGILGGAMVYYFYYEALRLYAEEYFDKI